MCQQWGWLKTYAYIQKTGIRECNVQSAGVGVRIAYHTECRGQEYIIYKAQRVRRV